MKIQRANNHVENHPFETVAKHIIDEIVSHAIWDKIGTITGIGHTAVCFLGGLLTFQKLEGGDEYLIPKSISKPIATWDINPATNRFENCILLANGKKLFGRDIIDFYQGLKFIKFV